MTDVLQNTVPASTPAYEEVAAWLIPHLVTFKNVQLRADGSKMTSCPPAQQELLEGTVSWSAEVFADSDVGVTDKHGVTHYPKPLIEFAAVPRLEESELDDLAHSALDEALSFGLGLDSFLRFGRAIRSKLQLPTSGTGQRERRGRNEKMDALMRAIHGNAAFSFEGACVAVDRAQGEAG